MKKLYTKIIATLGPASLNEDMIVKMARRGMAVVRINMSHGGHRQHQLIVDRIRHVNSERDLNIKILVDLEGYRIRLGRFPKPITVKKNQIIWLTNHPTDDPRHIPMDYEGNLTSLQKNASIFIDDGQIELKLIAHDDVGVKARVVQGGVISERKGVNIPTLALKSNIMTESDQKSVAFGIKNKVDFIAQSFVRNHQDILRVVDLVRDPLPNCKIISKIENYDGVKNIDKILQSCDGVMVARGDLGVSIPVYKIPMLQKYIIRHANHYKKISITATQMLDSMIEAGRPTRAEVSDVANAILDGTDYVMLSGETAVGRYPSRSIKMMHNIVEYTEKMAYMTPQ